MLPKSSGLSLPALAVLLASFARAQGPVVFVGSSTSSSTDRHYFVDPVAGTVLSGGASGFTDNVTDAVWSDYGATLFVSSSLQNRVNAAAWSGTTASWSTLYLAPAACYGLGLDRPRKRLWTLVGGGSSELHGIDVDPASATYGQAVAQTASLAGPIRERWCLSADGNLAAVPFTLLQSGTLDLVDLDPTSPTYLQIVHSSAVPGASSSFTFASSCKFSRDGRYLWLTYVGLGFSQLAVMDVSALTWLDFNSVATGTQSLSLFVNSANHLALSDDGAFGVISASGAPGSGVRVDLNPAAPSLSTMTEYLASQGLLTRCDGASLSSDSGSASFTATPGNLVGPSFLVTVDSASGTLLSNVQLTNIWNVYTTTWRETCPQPQSYCTAGTTTNGCQVLLSSSGAASTTAPQGFQLTADDVEGQRQGLIFYSLSGRAAAPWGASSSFLCVKAPTQRTPVQSSGGNVGACDGLIALDWNSFIQGNPGALGTPFTSGTIVQAQAWFRDPPSPKTTMLSNALEFEVCP